MTSVINSSKTITLSDVFIQISGNIFMNEHVGTNLYLTNFEADLYDTTEAMVYLIEGNFPEAILNHTIEIKNLNVYNSQPRTALLFTSFQILGDPNVTVTNATFDIYGSAVEDVGPFEVSINSAGVPQDDLTRYITIDSIHMRLKENTDSDRFNQFYMDFGEQTSRTEIVIYKNNIHEHISNSIYAMFDAYVQPNVEITFINNTFSNISGLYGAVYIYNGGFVTMLNNTFRDSTNFGFAIVSFEDVSGVFVSAFFIDSVIADGGSDEYFFYLKINEGFGAEYNNLTITNTELNDQPVIYIDDVIDSLSVTNSKFQNGVISPGNSIFEVSSIYQLEMSNLSFTGVYSNDEESSNSYMISITNFNLDSEANSHIDNVDITNCSVGLLSFDSVSETTDQQIQFSMENINYSNSDFLLNTDLVVFGGIETNQDFIITIDTIRFENMDFTQGGNLISYKSQMSNPMEITDITISNVTNGRIYLGAFNLQNTDLPAQLKLDNLSTDNINSQFRSLILINEGARLEISNSLFSNIYCYEEGAIISAGYQQSITTIYNTTFINNTAIQGSLFNTESESVIKMYNCEATNNFGVEAGLIKATTNGYFELYNSTFTNNYALSINIAMGFDSALPSIINGGNFYNNTILSEAQVITEITGKGKHLGFMSTNFKLYLSLNLDLLDVIVSEYLFQTISAQLIVTNQTTFLNEGELIDCFSSTLTIEDTLFTDINFDDSSLKLTSSNATISNVNISSVAPNNESTRPLIMGNLGTIGVIEDLSYSSSSVSFITFVSSSLSMTNVIASNITSEDQFISIVDW